MLYDITSPYFGGTVKGNAQAKRGYRRYNRPDCPQVCVGLVTSSEGLPLAFETFSRCRSHGRREKEVAILNRMMTGLETKLSDLAQQAESGYGSGRFFPHRET